jgi:hypothetical protein
MTIFLHIGVSKTGTTTIQKVLHGMSDRLRRERSIHYPGPVPNHRVVALPFLGARFFRPIDVYVAAGRGDRSALERAGAILLDDIARAAARYHVLILSSEQIRLLDLETVRGLASFLLGLGHEVKIVVYVRHPAERVSSLVSQAVRAGASHLADFRSVDDTASAIRTYSEVFGEPNMIVRRFGAQYFLGGDLLSDFMAAIGQEPLAGFVSPKLNPSLSLPAVLIADQFPAGDAAIRDRGLRERFLGRIAGPPFLVTRAMAERAIEAHAEGLVYLEREFAVRFDAVDLSIFPETFPSEFSIATVASIAELLDAQSRQIEELESEIERLRRHDFLGHISRVGRRAVHGLRQRAS